jgi:hypothetical protein
VSAADLVHRHRQIVEARDRLDSLLDAREAAQEGRGLAPAPAEIDRARAALETAEALLRAAEQDGGE